MRILRPLTLTIFGLMPLLLAAALPATKEPFTLFIAPTKATVMQGADARVEVTLRNISDRQIAMSKSDGSAYLVEVRDGQGRVARDTDLGRKLKDPGTVVVSSAPILPLKPGESLKDEIVVSKLYEMSGPGQYTVSVARPVPGELGTGLVHSNTITITITP